MSKKVIFSVIATVVFLTGCGSNTQDQDANTQPPATTPSGGDVDNSQIPEGCVTWFDGCNTCSVGEPGAPMACTMMACEEIQEPYCAKYEDGSSDAPVEIVPVSEEVQAGLENATYNIEGEDVTLENGKSEVVAAPGSATKIVTQTTQYMAEGDLQQGSGATLDGAVVLVQNPGGSGTFYYVGGVLQQPDKSYVAINGTYLLGDRIEIKEIKIDGRKIYVTYLDRGEDEAMSAKPTIEVTKEFATKGDVLMDVTSTMPSQKGSEETVGNDRDEYGCIGSAGYVWNEQTQKCERPWEQ